jgi:cytochrome P450
MLDVGQALMMLFSPAGRENPYPIYAQLREQAPVYKTPFGGWLVTRYEQADYVLRSSAFRTPRGFRVVNDPAGPARLDANSKLSLHRRNWIMFQSGEAHVRVRKLLMKVFTPRAVRALAPRIAELTQECLAPAVERGSMEVIADLAYPLPATVVCELLGVPHADRERLRHWAAAVVPTVDLDMCSDAQIAAAEQAMREWDAYIRELVAELRAKPRPGLLDDMLSVEEEGQRLTDDEVVANATFLFIAGHETTTNLLGNGILALLRNPAQLAALYATPALVENAIEELLRYDPPAQLAPRVALEPMELEGVKIEPEIVIALALGSANRDPRRYERPDELDVTRADPKPLSFGGGAHYCVGAALARLEAKHALDALLASTRTLGLASERIAWRPGVGMRGLESLSVRLVR